MQPISAAEELSQVMARVAAGDQAAFATFYDATSRTVFGIVLRVLRDRAQSEEVAQEVFLEAWRTAARFDPRQGTPSAWINTIAHRRAVDRVRSVERSTQRDQRHAQSEFQVDEPDVSDLVVSRDEGGRVRQALALLPEAQRTALALAYYDGRTQREVAELLNVPLGTVKTRMRDALRKLRTHLDEGGDSMNDDHELAALYVVDALTPEEVLEFESHLADCATCQAEVADMRSVTDQLSRSVDVDPPASLRASVLAGITATAQEPAAPTQPENVIPLRRNKPTRLPYLVAAASVVLALAFGGWALQSRNDAQQASEQQAQMLQLFTAPDVRTVTASTPAGASGTVVVSQDVDQAVFVARGMPELPDNQVYELWTINGTPVPAGTFTPSGPASVVTLPPAAASADTIAVTVEPAGGSDQPTSDPVMAVSLT